MYIGVDVGGMSIKAGVVNDAGKILAKHAVITPLDGNEGFLKATLEAINGAIKDAKVNKSDIKAIGIGYPGAVDRKAGILISANNVPGSNIPVREFLMENFAPVPVMVDNDANCAALGEFYRTEDAKDFVYVTLGTGVGGGIVIDGKLYLGFNGVAGELGHIITHQGGRKCSCGRMGCWEAYASVTALKNFTEENRHKLSLKKDEVISGRTVFEHAKRGEAEAKRIRDEWIEEIAIGITDIVNIFQPKELVIGGAISKEGDLILKPVEEYVRKYSYDVGPLPRTVIRMSDIGGDAGIIGAAFLYKNANQ